MTATLSAPDWLTKRGGSIRAHASAHAWVVCFDGQPQYVLRPFPVSGKFGCEVEQSINGKRFDGKEPAGSPEEALKAGLANLREQLGW